MSSRKLTIEEPCNESWAAMTPEENNRHCAKCDKTVVDFTGMSGWSILQFLDNAQGEVCGLIYPSQMNISVPRLVAHQRQPEFSLRALVFGLALSTFCALNTTAQGKVPIEQVQHQQEKQKDTPLLQYVVVAQRVDLSRIDSALVTVLFDDGSTATYFSDSEGICRFTAERPVATVQVEKDWQWHSQVYLLEDFDETKKLVATVEKYYRPIMGKVMVPPVKAEPSPVEAPEKPGK